jgi:hypothetical protein
MIRWMLAASLVMLGAGSLWAQDPARRVVIHADKTTEVAGDGGKSADLWVTFAELTKATGWEVKPEGVCSAMECIPIPRDRKEEFLAERAGTGWFNLSAFAKLLKQSVAHDASRSVWSFGPRPELHNAHRSRKTARG